MKDQLTTASAETARPADRNATRPRIYVACLAAYNSGRLHGAWIKASTPAEITREVRAMLAVSPVSGAEEQAIHDYEGFKGVHLSEYASFETVCALADFIEEHGELGAKLYACFGNDLEAARAAFEDYAGEYRSAAEFAEQLHEDTGTEIPESLRYYIDWQALARDMALNGEIMVFQLGFDEIHVFWSRQAVARLFETLGPRPNLTFVIAGDRVAQIWVNGRAPRITVHDYDWGKADLFPSRDADGFPYTRINWRGPPWALGLSLYLPDKGD